jgi:glutamate/tyrosine decarboxylase-like PLP-dependent enzyme
MLDADFNAALDVANELARAWLAGTDERSVTPPADAATVLASLPDALPPTGMEPAAVIRELAACAEPGLAGTGSGRYLALVTGGVLPSALGADWLVSAWDQNASFGEFYPAAVAIEHAAGRWILDLLDLPEESAVGFTTGAQGANTATLLAARNAVLAAHGYDVEARGLQGAPRVNIVVGDEQHSTVFRSLRFSGLGSDTAIRIPTDERGRMVPLALTAALELLDGPTIVYAQAGNVNGGGFDPIAEIADIVDAHRGRRSVDDTWFHIDGAFGLWVRAGRRHRSLADGSERADSWTCDAHKWLNVPYDCGISIVRDPQVLARAIGLQAAYLPEPGGIPNPVDLVPEASRRARGIPVWAAIRALGRDGMVDLIDRSCDRAAELADRLQHSAGVHVRAAEINQIIIGCDATPTRSAHERTRDVLAAVVAEGDCYPSSTVWKGEFGIRLSVSNWRTDEDDVNAIVASIERAVTRSA